MAFDDMMYPESIAVFMNESPVMILIRICNVGVCFCPGDEAEERKNNDRNIPQREAATKTCFHTAQSSLPRQLSKG